MEIRIRETGAIISEHEFRSMHSRNVSFPAVLTLEMLTEFGAEPIMEGAQPTAGRFQSMVRDGVEYHEGFGWFTKYVLRTWSQEEIDAAIEEQWKAIKRARDALLAQTDWIVIRATEMKIPLPEDWKTYRQALRDITQQADPFAIDWPTQPQL